MTTQAQQEESERVRQMLRHLMAGDLVRATRRAPMNRQGHWAKVIDPDYQLGDGTRRIKVRWDDGTEVAVIPASIETPQEG